MIFLQELDAMVVLLLVCHFSCRWFFWIILMSPEQTFSNGCSILLFILLSPSLWATISHAHHSNISFFWSDDQLKKCNKANDCWQSFLNFSHQVNCTFMCTFGQHLKKLKSVKYFSPRYFWYHLVAAAAALCKLLRFESFASSFIQVLMCYSLQ